MADAFSAILNINQAEQGLRQQRSQSAIQQGQFRERTALAEKQFDFQKEQEDARLSRADEELSMKRMLFPLQEEAARLSRDNQRVNLTAAQLSLEDQKQQKSLEAEELPAYNDYTTKQLKLDPLAEPPPFRSQKLQDQAMQARNQAQNTVAGKELQQSQHLNNLAKAQMATNLVNAQTVLLSNGVDYEGLKPQEVFAKAKEFGYEDLRKKTQIQAAGELASKFPPASATASPKSNLSKPEIAAQTQFGKDVSKREDTFTKAISDLDQYQAYLDQGEGTGPISGRIPFNTANQSMEALENGIAMGLRVAGTGAMSDKDLAFLKARAPSIKNTEEANKNIIAGLKGTFARNMAADAYISGRLQEGATLSEARKEVKAYASANPLFKNDKGTVIINENPSIEEWVQSGGKATPKTEVIKTTADARSEFEAWKAANPDANNSAQRQKAIELKNKFAGGK